MKQHLFNLYCESCTYIFGPRTIPGEFYFAVFTGFLCGVSVFYRLRVLKHRGRPFSLVSGIVALVAVLIVFSCPSAGTLV